tara:strand:- start:7 stop:486 length:480 start_codon:yes stop_codon:yes gene_type:complete
MQSVKFLKKNNFPEYIKMEWDLLDIIVNNLFSPYFNYNDDYSIEITTEELKIIYNDYISGNIIDYDAFYEFTEDDLMIEDTDNLENINIYDYIYDNCNLINYFDKKYGKNGIINALSCRKGVVEKDNIYDKLDNLWEIYPKSFIAGLSEDFKKDIELYN